MLPLRTSWSLVVGPVVLLAALLVCAGPARAQQPAGRKPAPDTATARQFEKDLNEAEGYNASTRNVVRVFKTWFVLVVLATVGGVIVIGFKVVAWVVARTSAPTSPEQLALSDPWVRAKLAEERAARGEPADDDR